MAIRENIIKLREMNQITQEQLAEIAGVSRGAVSQWEGGFSEPRMGAIQRMADYFNISKSNIIEDGGMDVCYRSSIPGAMKVRGCEDTYIPLLSFGRVHAGSLTDEEAAEKTINVPSSVANNHPNAFALEVEGNCMNHVIPEGAHVLVDPDVYPSNGSIVVAETEDYQAIMRRWYKGSKSLMLVADSYEEFEDLIFTGDEQSIKAIGTVVWFQAAKELN